MLKPIFNPSIFLIIICLTSCSNELKDFETKVRSALKDNQGVSSKEFKDLLACTKSNPSLTEYSNSASLVRLIEDIADEMCQSKRNPIDCSPKIDTGEKETAPGSTTFHVFFENSLSMSGYLNGKTEFIDATLDLMTRMSLKEAGVQLYYINREAYPVSHVIKDYVSFLQPQNVSQYGKEGQKNSEINDIIKIVADTACKKENRIALVISDYIYSINGHKVQEELDLQKHTTTLSLKNLAKRDFAVLIIKLSSKFKGNYYPMQGPGVAIDEKRPVYMWFMGPKDKIVEFPKLYNIYNLGGYETHLVLLNEDQDESPYYTILDKTAKEGRFEKEDRSATTYHAIKSAAPSRDGTFQFALAVDLSGCPADDAYLSDASHYAVESDAGDVFEVVDVKPIVEIEHNDKIKQKGSATHIIVLAAHDKLAKGKQNLKLVLKKSIPNWVADASTESDLDLSGRQNKTFGLSYLISGAAAAFEYGEKSAYYTFPITIDN